MQLQTEMSHFFIGPMPPQDFLDVFLPLPSASVSFSRGMFSDMIRCSKEVNMYDKFVSYASDLTRLFEPNLNFPGLDHFAIPPKFEARQYVPYGRLGHYNGFPFSLST